MQLKKIVTVEAETTDGKRMVVGMDYVIITVDRSLCGTYRGISGRGALIFEVPLKGDGNSFNIMPSSIEMIFEAAIEIKRAYMNATEQEEAANEN